MRLKNPAFAGKKIEIRNDGMYVFDNGSSQWNAIDDTTGFTFSFVDSESTTTDETILSTTTDKDLQWNVASILNLDISPNKSMTLKDYQTITLLTEPEVKLTGTIYTNKPLSSVGGENVDVRWYDITTLSYKPLEFYCYGTAKDTEDNWVWSNTQSNITLTKPAENESISFTSKNEYTLLPGNYIVPVIIKTESATDIKIGLKTDDGTIYYLRPDSNSANTGEASFTSAGSYYCRVIINNQRLDYKLVIVSNDVATIIFNPLHEYNTDGTIFNDTGYLDRIYNKTQQLDKNHYFNYTYEVPEEQLIENPLDATSFFKSAHIYNKNTIAQWRSQSDESRFTILNKIR